VQADVDALPLTVVSVITSTDELRSKIETTGDLAPGEVVHTRFRLKPIYAELVLATVNVEGWTDMPARRRRRQAGSLRFGS
jgi:hypothetical protein